MKVKLDENMPASLVDALSALGHDVDSAPAEGLDGQPDQHVWQAAQASGRFLITQDLDFSDIRQYQPGMHHGLLLIRLQKPGRLALARRVETLFQSHSVEEWARCFVIATEIKLKVRRPTN